MFAPVIPRHYSLAPLCQRNLKAQRSIHYKRNQETLQRCTSYGDPVREKGEYELYMYRGGGVGG